MCFETATKKSSVAQTIASTTKLVKFKVGDKVKLLRSAKAGENGWQNGWNVSMDKAIGKIGTVTMVDTRLAHDINVKFPEVGIVFGYPDFALEKVEIESPSTTVALVATTDRTALRADSVLASKFNTGDKVRVSYIDYDSPNEGKIAEVVGRTYGSGYVTVKFSHLDYTLNLFPQRLTLVESKAIVTGYETRVETKPAAPAVLTLVDFKVGDRVQVKYGFGWDGPGSVTKVNDRFVVVQPDHMKGRTGNFFPSQLTKLTPASTQTAPASTFAFALGAAVALAKQHGVTNADEVQAAIAKTGITPAQLGNAAGAIFRSKNWEKVGTIKSTRPGNHSRLISTWKYVGA